MAIKLVKVQKKILGGPMKSTLFVSKGVAIDDLTAGTILSESPYAAKSISILSKQYAIAGWTMSEIDADFATNYYQYTKAAFYVSRVAYNNTAYGVDIYEDIPGWDLKSSADISSSFDTSAEKEAYAQFLKNSCKLIGSSELFVASTPNALTDRGLSTEYFIGDPPDDILNGCNLFSVIELEKMIKVDNVVGDFFIHVVIYKTDVHLADSGDTYIALD